MKQIVPEKQKRIVTNITRHSESSMLTILDEKEKINNLVQNTTGYFLHVSIWTVSQVVDNSKVFNVTWRIETLISMILCSFKPSLFFFPFLTQDNIQLSQIKML